MRALTEKRRTLAAIPTAMICIAVASGCGGGGSESPQHSKAQFITQGDIICANGKKQVEARFVSYLKKNKLKKIGEKGESKAEAEGREAAVIETIALPALSKQVNELKAFGMPREDEAKAKEYISAVEERIEKGEQDPQSLFSASSKVLAKSDKLAGELGFKVCGHH